MIVAKYQGTKVVFTTDPNSKMAPGGKPTSMAEGRMQNKQMHD